MRLTIGKKILLGYLPLLGVIVAVAGISLFRLSQVKIITDSVLQNEIKVRMISERMLISLSEQEFTCRKALLYGSEDMFHLVQLSTNDYSSDMTLLSSSQTYGAAPELQQLFTAYRNLIQESRALVINRHSENTVLNNASRIALYDKQKVLLEMINETAEANQQRKSEDTVSIVQDTYELLVLITIIGVILSLIIASIIIHHIVDAVSKLKKASQHVANGAFHQLPTVTSNDELGSLSATFNEMAHRLFLLEETYKDASPLTRLPGGIAVEEAVKQRIDNAVPFAFCLLDLDNFKPFNDRYGYSHGNTVLIKTAELIQEVTREKGTSNDFVGHIGGDDFVVVSTPECFENICQGIIDRFDDEIRGYYEDADISNGFIVSTSRKGETLKFPIMTISIAAIDSTLTRITNYIEVGEIFAELKKYAKSYKTSKLVVERRMVDRRKEKRT